MFNKKTTTAVFKNFKHLKIVPYSSFVKKNTPKGVKTKKKGDQIIYSPSQSFKENSIIEVNILEINNIIIEDSYVAFSEFLDTPNTFSIDMINSYVEFKGDIAFETLYTKVINTRCLFLKGVALHDFYMEIKEHSYVSMQNKGMIGTGTFEISKSIFSGSNTCYFERVELDSLEKTSDFTAAVLYTLDVSIYDYCSNAVIYGSPSLNIRDCVPENKKDSKENIERFISFNNLDIDGFYQNKHYNYYIDETYIYSDCILEFEYPYYIIEAFEKRNEYLRKIEDPVSFEKEKKKKEDKVDKELLSSLLIHDYPTEKINSSNRDNIKRILNEINTNKDKYAIFEFKDEDLVKIHKMCFVLEIESKTLRPVSF